MVLTVYPQVSLVTSFLKTQAGDYPQISTREARTTVSMKSGATLSIGGLIRDDDIKSITKVPLLGDLPFIGQFFRRDKKSRDRTEIVILLSPTIMAED
jgi:pilus assembly protein CpaC